MTSLAGRVWLRTTPFVKETLLLMLCIQPALRQSFVEVFFGLKEAPEDYSKTEVEESGQKAFSQLVPGEAAPPASLPGVVEVVETLEIEDIEDNLKSEDSKGIPAELVKKSGDENRISAKSAGSARSAQSVQYSVQSEGSKNPGDDATNAAVHTYSYGRPHHRKEAWAKRSSARSSQHSSATRQRVSQFSNATALTKVTKQTNRTSNTSRTARTAGTVVTALSRMTSLSEAGEDYRHHFGTAGALQPQIVGATGAKAALRDDVKTRDADGKVVEQEGPTKRASIPKDVRLPAFLIVLNCFCNNTCYAIEFVTFAIFFKQVHNWNEAIWASLTQTAGDVMAAVAMQIIPAIFPDNFDEDEAGPIRRFFHYSVSQPYTLTTTLVTLFLFNAGMMSPWLPLAIVAQVFMGSSYVYSSKWSTDMNLFYSLGDSNVFLTLQVYCRNAEAVGGSMAGLLGIYLFTLDPIAPFAFSTGLAFLCLVLYTVGFCARLGFGDDIESAEAKRSRRKGINRVSSWMADAGNRNSQAPGW